MFADVFARARRAGLQATAHAGETASVHSILDSVDMLGCTRIDHGYAVLEDETAVRRCRGAGITFTVSSRTADMLRIWGVDVPPAAPTRMWRAGLRVSPATDAPAHFATP